MAVFTKKKGELADAHISTIVSEGCIIEGKIKAKDSIRIDGEVLGDVEVQQGVIMGTNGVIKGNIKAVEAIIFGSLTGNINVQKLEIKSTGKVVGDISTQILTMETGGKHNGQVSMGEMPVNSKPKQEPKNELVQELA
jgi:cytoskeletal protein CcmA (bactofilin family)